MNKPGIRAYVALVLIPLFGCASVPEEKPTTPTVTTPAAAVADDSKPVACALPTYDLATVGAKRKRLSSKDVQNMLQRSPGLPGFFNSYNKYQDLLVLDTLRCQSYALLAVLWRHEYCCEDLYYLTTSLSDAVVLDSARVASRGLDGQWHAEASMRLAANGELWVTALEENDTDEENESNTLDSVVTAYAVTPQGKFHQKQISRVRRNLRLGEHIPDPKRQAK